jgi:hypothetical protein
LISIRSRARREKSRRSTHEIPCEVDRYRVGKHSPGTMKVVVLGPKFWKKLARQ